MIKLTEFESNSLLSVSFAQFYRYTPNPTTPNGNKKMPFSVVGVLVDVNRSNDKEVWLRTNKRSTGQYKCQVSIEGTFNSVSAEKRMEVVESGGSLASGNGADSSTSHLAGASVWQQHVLSQQHENRQPNQGSFVPNSRTVQQNPSQVYGLTRPTAAAAASASAQRFVEIAVGPLVGLMTIGLYLVQASHALHWPPP